MTDNVVRFSAPPGQPELMDMAEALLRRVRDGLVLGLALVEHREGDAVTYEVFGPVSYHHLNSGAARLAYHLASQEHDT